MHTPISSLPSFVSPATQPHPSEAFRLRRSAGNLLGLGLAAACCISADVSVGCADPAGTTESPLRGVTAPPSRAAQQGKASAASLPSLLRASPPDPGLVVSGRHRGVLRSHRVGSGVCVTFTPPPPAWAYRADGTLKSPAEIHRFKEGGEQILFLNFDGAHVTVGHDDPEHNQSAIPYSDVDVPAFDDAPFQDNFLDSREKVIDAILRWVTYFYAHMPVRVTAERPPAGTPYTMLLVGGRPQVLGEQTGVLGVATFDCYKDPRNVGFVFSEDHGSDLEMLVYTIVHEAGHTFGLAHIDDPSGIMYPANPEHGASWSSGNTTDSYACDGSSTQESFAVLQEVLGTRADLTPPWVEIQSPGPEATVSPPLLVLVHGSDNVVLHRVELFLDDVSVGETSLPTFDFSVAAVDDGDHALYAVGEDAHGNTSTSETVSVSVSANCAALETCRPGLGAVGDPCAAGADCQSGRCAQTATATVCSRACVDGLNPCPFGTDCLPESLESAPDGGVVPSWCGQGPGPVQVLSAENGSALSGCAAVGGLGSGSGLGWILLLGFWLARALRKRR